MHLFEIYILFFNFWFNFNFDYFSLYCTTPQMAEGIMVDL